MPFKVGVVRSALACSKCYEITNEQYLNCLKFLYAGRQLWKLQINLNMLVVWSRMSRTEITDQ